MKGGWRQCGISLWVMETDPKSRPAYIQPNSPLYLFVLSCHSVSLHVRTFSSLWKHLLYFLMGQSLENMHNITGEYTHTLCIQHCFTVANMYCSILKKCKNSSHSQNNSSQCGRYWGWLFIDLKHNPGHFIIGWDNVAFYLTLHSSSPQRNSSPHWDGGFMIRCPATTQGVMLMRACGQMKKTGLLVNTAVSLHL